MKPIVPVVITTEELKLLNILKAISRAKD